MGAGSGCRWRSVTVEVMGDMGSATWTVMWARCDIVPHPSGTKFLLTRHAAARGVSDPERNLQQLLLQHPDGVRGSGLPW